MDPSWHNLWGTCLTRNFDQSWGLDISNWSKASLINLRKIIIG